MTRAHALCQHGCRLAPMPPCVLHCSDLWHPRLPLWPRSDCRLPHMRARSVIERDGVALVCDSVSLDFLRGAVVEYEDSLMRSAFQVASNPNSESTCGCGTSFVAKL